MSYFLVSLIPFVAYLILKTKKSLHMLQLNWYNLDQRYLKWMIQNPAKIFVDIDAFFFIFLAFLFTSESISMILFVVFYLVVMFLYHRSMVKEQVKIPLKVTARVKRLILTLILLYAIPIITIACTYHPDMIAYYYLLLGLLTYLNSFVVMTAEVINKPVEKIVFNHYKHQATRKLKSMTNLEVIGITGSYGKTSSKNILNDILNVSYNVFPTPQNYNTPIGLIISINNYLDKFNDYFIAEMGAFKMGEIQELCDLVHPKYGILTTIGTAHLESFGSRENIQSGKFELIESLPLDGVGVLNADDPYQVSYELQNQCKILWIGIDNQEIDVDVRATNIKLSDKGTSFNVRFKDDDKVYPFTTRLLGKHNIYNILAAIALGHEFGLTVSQLQAGVKKVNTIEHRLELKKVGTLNIIDDAYNSNPVGSKMALEVLDLMPGKKIIITPGMIELGEKQYELNMKFGQYISEVCDEVILVGAEQTKPIYDGLLSKKYNEKKIHVINDVKEGFVLMHRLAKDETYILIENDLPDLFNEKK